MLLIGVVLTVTIGLGVYWFVLRQPSAEPPYSGNAIWLGVTWAMDPHPDEEIRLLGEHLREHHIRDVYVYVSYFRTDTNEWNETFDYAGDFVGTLKEAHPDARVFGWLGVPINAEDGTYRLDSETVQARVAQFAKRTAEFGFEGVHLNVETILDGNEDYLVLLEAVRDELPEDTVLSVSVPPDWNPGRADVPAGEYADEGMAWDGAYKQEVGARVDQVVLMAYNSGLESPADYETWMAYQVEAFAGALGGLPDDIDVELVVGVPTYAEDAGHSEWAESLRAALNGVHDGLRRAGDDSAVVAGVALYAFWDTDAVEWALFREMWLNPLDD
jgi:hypothetical protein